MFNELEALEAAGVAVTPDRLVVSDRAHMLFDLHKEVDGLREAELSGTRSAPPSAASGRRTRARRRATACAWATCAIPRSSPPGSARSPRTRRRFDDFEYDVEAEIENYKVFAEKVKPYIQDTVALVNASHKAGKRILVEGANATMLDLDFGTYPFVTSSNPSLGGVCSGLGLAPNKFESVIGVAKAYTTRVGAGPYPTELFGDLADDLREKGFEYGTTTGRPRRIGWLDVVALNFASQINGFTHINLTKLDVLSGLPELKIGVAYKLSSGETTTDFPSDTDAVGEVEVVYETMPGWEEDISARAWDELPRRVRRTYENRGCAAWSAGTSASGRAGTPSSSSRETTDERDERRVDGDETFRNSFRRRRGAPDETGRERARGDDAMGEWTDATWRRGGPREV